jgi:hypothetical protein
MSVAVSIGHGKEKYAWRGKQTSQRSEIETPKHELIVNENGHGDNVKER